MNITFVCKVLYNTLMLSYQCHNIEFLMPYVMGKCIQWNLYIMDTLSGLSRCPDFRGQFMIKLDHLRL